MLGAGDRAEGGELRLEEDAGAHNDGDPKNLAGEKSCGQSCHHHMYVRMYLFLRPGLVALLSALLLAVLG